MQEFKNSQDYLLKTSAELDLELISKFLAAAPGYIMVAVWAIFQRFDTVQYAGLVRGFGIFLLLMALSRFCGKYLYDKKFLSFELWVRFVKASIMVNAVLWSTLVLIPLIELRFRNPASNIVIISMIVGTALSSMLTLSSNVRMAYFFQSITLVPPGSFLFYLYMSDQNDQALSAVIVLAIAYIYILNQNRFSHAQVLGRIRHGLELEHINQLLKVSQAQLIEEKAKLQHSIRLAALGEISGEIAHEVNNPLSLVLGYIELASEQLKSPDFSSEMVLEKLNKATKAITRITKIIKGLRQYSRNTLDEPPVIADLSEIIDDVVDFCSEKFIHHNITIDVNLSSEFKISCRPIEISQVVLNIFTNAIDEVAKLDPDQRKIGLSTEVKGSIIKISIYNTGPQIDPAIQSRLFEPFFSTKKVGIGTGLGLSISKNIIESHSGRLYYDDSQVLTTFIIELPLYS